jgi:hypothetical protein
MWTISDFGSIWTKIDIVLEDKRISRQETGYFLVYKEVQKIKYR